MTLHGDLTGSVTPDLMSVKTSPPFLFMNSQKPYFNSFGCSKHTFFAARQNHILKAEFQILSWREASKMSVWYKQNPHKDTYPPVFI